MADNSRNRDTSHGTESEAFSDPKIGEVHAQLAREKEEPREGFSGVPITIVFLFCALGFWGSVYFTRNTGNFDALRYETQEEKAVVAATGPKSVADQIKDGEKIFNQNCALCHQASGAGVPGAFPPLAGSPWVVGTPERLVKIAHYGIAGEIEVLGAKYNGAMGNIAAGLSDQKLADLSTYVRQAWGNKGEPVDADTVKAIRAATGKRGAYTPAEMLATHPLEQ